MTKEKPLGPIPRVRCHIGVVEPPGAVVCLDDIWTVTTSGEQVYVYAGVTKAQHHVH